MVWGNTSLLAPSRELKVGKVYRCKCGSVIAMHLSPDDAELTECPRCGGKEIRELGSFENDTD